MGFFDKLRELFSGGDGGAAAGDPHGVWFHFRCGNCGEVVRVRINTMNDLSSTEGGPGAYYVRKEVMDSSSRCFQRITAELWLDSTRRSVVTSDVVGGELISQEEYEAALVDE